MSSKLEISCLAKLAKKDELVYISVSDFVEVNQTSPSRVRRAVYIGGFEGSPANSVDGFWFCPLMANKPQKLELR